MIWKVVATFVLSFAALTCALTVSPTYYFFTPPASWEIADPSELSSHVKIAFLKPTGKGFCPSINLAIESTSVSLNDYLKSVKAIHEQDRNNQWRALGKVKTAAGMAQLTSIDSHTEWGPIRILQLIFMKEGHAYILTAAALKEEFPSYYKEIQSAFRSFTLTSDLLSAIPQLERREALKQKEQVLVQTIKQLATTSLEDPLFQKEHWLPFQQTILDTFSDMGAYWQALLLQATQSKLTAELRKPLESVSEVGEVKRDEVSYQPFPRFSPFIWAGSVEEQIGFSLKPAPTTIDKIIHPPYNLE